MVRGESWFCLERSAEFWFTQKLCTNHRSFPTSIRGWEGGGRRLKSSGNRDQKQGLGEFRSWYRPQNLNTLLTFCTSQLLLLISWPPRNPVHYEWSILLVSAEDVVCWAHSAGHDGGQDFARTSGAEGGAADQEVTEQKLLLHHQQLQWASVCLGHSLPCLLLWHSAGRDGSTEALFVGFLLSTVYIQVLESFAI